MKTKLETILIICLAGYAGIHDFYLKKNTGIGLLKFYTFLNWLFLYQAEILTYYQSPGSYYLWFLTLAAGVPWLVDLIRFIRISPRRFYMRYVYKTSDFNW